jgi:hypothetical protein
VVEVLSKQRPAVDAGAPPQPLIVHAEQGGQDEGAGEVWAEPLRCALQDRIPRLPTGNGQERRQTSRRRRNCPPISAAMSGTTRHRPETPTRNLWLAIFRYLRFRAQRQYAVGKPGRL